MTGRDFLLRELADAVDELVAHVEATARDGWCCDPHRPCDAAVEDAADRVEGRLTL